MERVLNTTISGCKRGIRAFAQRFVDEYMPCMSICGDLNEYVFTRMNLFSLFFSFL
jgi:hypothetical protein